MTCYCVWGRLIQGAELSINKAISKGGEGGVCKFNCPGVVQRHAGGCHKPVITPFLRLTFWVVITVSDLIWDCKLMEASVWKDCCVQFGDCRLERRERIRRIIACRQESQGMSATPSSNTHSGWASSHYSPPGAKLHLPHRLTTTQSASTHPHARTTRQITAAISQYLKLRCCINTQTTGSWVDFYLWMNCRHHILSNYRALLTGASPVQQPWPLWLVKHEKTCSTWPVAQLCFCQINMCTEKQAVVVNVNGFSPQMGRLLEDKVMGGWLRLGMIQTWSCFLWSNHQSTQYTTSADWAQLQQTKLIQTVHHMSKKLASTLLTPTNFRPVYHCSSGGERWDANSSFAEFSQHLFVRRKLNPCQLVTRLTH